jgi:DNA (cytosine-5)-methyltransferase 1
MKFITIDLFSGAGGLTSGLNESGFQTILASDFDKQISNTFQKNFKNIKFLCEDIKKINFLDIKKEMSLKKNELDLIVGGPPCQGFSMANRKRIEDDPRNLLFRNFFNAVKILKPKCFLIENVAGLKSEDISLRTKQQPATHAIANYFKSIDYEIKFLTFRSEEFGIPQFRRRVLIIGTNISKKKELLKRDEIGNLEGKYKSYESIKTENFNQAELFSNEKPNPFFVWDALSDLPKIKAGQNGEEKEYISEPKNDYQKLMRKNSKKVYNHVATPHDEMAIKRIKLIKQGQNFRDLPKNLQTKSVHSGAWGRLEANGLAPTITTRFDTPSVGRVIHPYQDRTLTVREAARIQSFPDDFIFYGNRTSQGIQVGNSVPPLVGKAIGKMFIKQFLS